MKKIIFGLTLLVGLVFSTQAQSYGVATLGTGISVVSSNTVSNAVSTATINCSKMQNLGVMVSFANQVSPNTSNVVFSFSRSLDNVTYDTTSGTQFSITMATTGSTNVSYATNWNVGGIGYLRLDSIRNYATNFMTNIVIQYSVKRSAP